MDTLADFSSAGSSLPWLWIIEYLASFKEVETCYLQDLVEMVPEVSDDLEAAAREMVALRCLEDWSSSTDKVSNDGLSATDKKVEIALSESCEDVLHQITKEISVSNLETVSPDLLKWDVHPFVMHKRASLPKCALQRLKDIIVEGTHPFACSLKERSSLMCENICGTAHVGDLDRRNDQSMLEKENLFPLISENRAGLLGALNNKNVLPCKRVRDDMAARDTAGHTNEVQVESDLNYNAKKLKQDAISNLQCADKISAPFFGKETVEPFSGGDVAVARGEGSHIENQSQDERVEESQLLEDGSDNCVDLETQAHDGAVSDDQIRHNQVVDCHTADQMPQDEHVHLVIIDEATVPSTCLHSVGTQHKETVDESRGELEHPRGEEVSSHSDEYHDERIDVAVKKSQFLSSQFSLSHDSLAMSGWTGQNLCLKCNNDGQVLSCSTRNCPLVVHENCLGFPLKFDENGNFLCPFCAYTLAISDYLEAKKKVSMVRKELASFIQKGSDYHQKDLADILQRKVPGHSWSDGDKDIHETAQVGGQENDQEIQNGQNLHDVNDHLKERAGDKDIHENGHVGGKENQEIQNGQSLHDVNDHQKGRANKKKAKPSASCVNVNSKCRDREANTSSGRDSACNEGNALEENIINGCPSKRGLEGQPEHSDHTEAEDEIQKEDLQYASSDPPEKPVIALNIDGEENSEGENDKFIISNYSIRFRRQERHHTYPASPILRRKKVPWTAKEEEMLKKGVQKFASVEERTIPWKKILEFGSYVFLSGRTAIDLKDKWRNMCKGSPKSK